jgi:p-hydroxybenzoic acid efflux pump subunit AaeB
MKCCGRSGGKAESAERHHAMVNFWHLRLLYPRDAVLAVDRLDLRQRGDGDDCRGYALAMRLPNPRMVAIDFLYGTLAALPLGTLYFLVIMPRRSRVCCCCVSAWRRWRSLSVSKCRKGARIAGALASTINILVLDNPMQFQFSQFLDSALGQIVGCFLALMVILLVGIIHRPNRSGAAESVCLGGGLIADHQYRASKRTICPRSISSCFCC